MKYDFPLIEHINDVLPAIKDDENFYVAERPGYKVINYLLSDPTSFPKVLTREDAIRRECRGIVFDDNGYVIARRLHKFFNVGEREETHIDLVDWNQSHIVLDKLDGSMITPFEIGGEEDAKIIWGTKMGDTDVAKPVQDFVAKNPKYVVFAHRNISSRTTPIFEWVSRSQRIVLDYPEDQLILIAIRSNHTGWYMPYDAMKDVAKKFDIPVVGAHTMSMAGGNHKRWIGEISKREDIEGIVVRFDDGQMLKIKTEWYVRIHKNKELISSEKNVVELIVNNQLDDVLSFLMEPDREKVLRYEEEFKKKLHNKCKETYQLLFEAKQKTRKEFALSSNDMTPMLRGMIFKLFDETITSELIQNTIWETIKKHCTSNQMFAKLKEWFLRDLKYE